MSAAGTASGRPPAAAFSRGLGLGEPEEGVRTCRPASILVVDDEALICTQVGEMLEAAGHRLAGTAASAPQAVAQAAELVPDLVLMDMVMPGKGDGLDACATIQQDLGIPVVLITAYGFEPFLGRVRDAAPYGYVLKPCTDEQILAAVEVALNRWRSERAASDLQCVRVREAHHRAKNSFMLAHSLLRLRQESQDSESARQCLAEAANQIFSLAKIHEQLHGLDALESVDCRHYLENLVETLRQACGPALELVRIHLDVDDLRLPASKAIPCGLVLNELVTNALKHAFAPGRGGNIWISLRRDADGVRLEVRDDGVGFAPAGTGLGEGLGMELVEALAEQLGGWFRRSPAADGAVCRLEFPLAP